VLTLQSAIITYSRNLIAVVGTFTLNGINVLFPRASKIFASTTTFELSIQTTILRYGRKIEMAFTTFTITGQSILSHIGKKLIAVYGSFNLSGFNAKFPIYWKTLLKNISSWRNTDKSNI